jgi:hypothetical protein
LNAARHRLGAAGQREQSVGVKAMQRHSADEENAQAAVSQMPQHLRNQRCTVTVTTHGIANGNEHTLAHTPWESQTAAMPSLTA